MIRRSRTEIVDFSEKEVEKISYCKECLKFGFSVPLKNRIYPNNEPIPADHENWLQCYECGTIVPVYEIEKEASIKDVVETSDNPFDSGKEFLGIDSRELRSKKSKQMDYDYINDPEVKGELRKGHTLISYTES